MTIFLSIDLREVVEGDALNGILGLGRATVKIGIANLAYNFRRLILLEVFSSILLPPASFTSPLPTGASQRCPTNSEERHGSTQSI